MIQGFSSGFLNRKLMYNLDLPSFQRDFASLKTLDHGTGPAITFTRASNATYFDANGVLQTASNDQPRFDHDPATGASRGLLIEEARTNSIRNSQAGGSTNGVIGSGGALPTNWGQNGITNNVTGEIIGTGTENGLAYIDIKLSGTPSATASVTLRLESATQVVAANGQTWTASAFVKLAAGSTANTTVRVGIQGRDVAGLLVSGQDTNKTIAPTSAALTTQRASATRTMSDATVERAFAYVLVTYTSGDPIDLTLRIAAPQLEQGAFPTSYIPTTTAAATRSADSAVVTPISSFYNQSEGTLFAEYSGSQPNKSVFQFDNNTNNERVAIIASSTTAIPAGLVVATTTQASIGVGATPTSTDIIKAIFAAQQNDFQAARGGALGTADTSGTMPAASLTNMNVGSLASGSAAFGGHIRKIAYWPKRLSNTLLEQLTT